VTSARLGETLCRIRGGFSGVFAWARAIHLGENTRSLLVPTGKSTVLMAEFNQATTHNSLTINLALRASIRLINMIHGLNRIITDSFPYL